MMPGIPLDDILDALEKYRQRATYGAVGDLTGVPAQSVMNGRPRDPRHSWVVRRSNGLPTGYSDAQKHAALLTRAHVITAEDELRAWLREPS